jgi:dihydrolipoamide dehydrogenase
MVVGEMANGADLVIIGGGPGGYHAAIRAAQLGRQVLLIEKADLGGICLNKGCIPSKVITVASARLEDSKKNAVFGIEVDRLGFNFEKLKEYQKGTVEGLRTGVEALCKANKVQILKGTAFFISETRIGVEQGDNYELYDFNQAIIAAGVRPDNGGTFKAGKRIVNSWSISFLEDIPEHLAIYGVDTIHLEMAMAYKALGSDVTLLLPQGVRDFPYDSSISRELSRIFKKERIPVLKDCSIREVIEQTDGVTIVFASQTGATTVSATHFFYGEKKLPNSDELGLKRIGINLDDNGYVKVNEKCRTNFERIYAIGDINGGPFLASKALKQGKVAAEVACGIESSLVDLRFLPQIAFTRPPIAYVGLSEEKAIDQGLVVKASQFPLASNGISGLTGKKDGFVKIVSEDGTDVILGVHIIGEGAHELIAGGIIGLEMGAREEDFTFPSFPHPGLAEAMLEAAEDLKGKAVHLKPQKKRVEEPITESN